MTCSRSAGANPARINAMCLVGNSPQGYVSGKATSTTVQPAARKRSIYMTSVHAARIARSTTTPH